jgi:hypothetical protein
VEEVDNTMEVLNCTTLMQLLGIMDKLLDVLLAVPMVPEETVVITAGPLVEED